MPKDKHPSAKEIFLSSEGDRYFERNAAKEAQPHFAYEAYAQHLGAGRRLLEIGCYRGTNLSHLQAESGCEAYGIDPSARAIADAQASHPALHLTVGTADRLPYPDAHFDMVVFGFCLYLIDRALLFQAVAEADRVLADGGYLAIFDFDSPRPVRRPYRYHPGLMSHKMDYPALFLASPHYSLVEKTSFSLAGPGFVEGPEDRVASSLLFKSVERAYAFEPDA